jgi:hypothetical protein
MEGETFMSQQVFDSALELRPTGAAITATASSTGVQVNPRFLPTCDWCIYASGVLGTGTYTFTLEVSDLVGGTYTAIATAVWPPALSAGRMHIPINGDLAAFKDSDCRFARVTATLGATSSIVYGSYLAKAANRLGAAYRPFDIVTVS